MKIVNGVKTFFKNYLTSKGIAYRKLKNIEEVLSEKAYVMDKGVASSEKVPSGIKSRFKTENEQLTPRIISDIINNANPVFLKDLVTVSQAFLSNTTVKSELKNAINKMKQLEAKLMAAQYNKKDYLDNVKDKGLIKGTAANLQQRGDIKNAQNELNKTKQEVEKHLDEDTEAKDLAEQDDEIQTKKLNEILEQYKNDFNSKAKALIKEKEVYFANGKVLKLNEDDKEDGFLVFKTDVAENAQSPKSIIYAEQQTLLGIVKRMTAVLTEADHVSDQVNKFLGTADKSMAELDSIYRTLSSAIKDYPENSPQAKAMKVMNKKINDVLKPFTQSLKNAISQTFKLSTNILDNAISVAHGVIAYGVESMKLYTEK
jgi:vacuolar-type H+-ATPase subunit I/STV1